MRHTFHKIRAVISALLILGLVLSPSTTKAAETLTDAFPDPVWKTYPGSVDGVERTLFVTKAENSNRVTPYIKIGDWEPEDISTDDLYLDVAMDEYGSVQILCSDTVVFWWNYDLNPDFFNLGYYAVPNPDDPERIMQNIESFVIKDGILVGYKSSSGTIYPVPSFTEMKEFARIDSPVEPHFIPKIPDSGTPLPSATPVASVSPTQTPSASTSTPMATVTPTEKPTQVPATPTPVPAVSAPPTQAPPALTLTPSTPVTVPETPSAPLISMEPNVVQPAVTPTVTKLSIKKSKKKGVTTYSLCEGNKVAMEYSLKKGMLNWKAGKKKGTMENVKYVAFIKKSRNLYLGDKKGRGYIISSKTGKKKLIIKKGAKKPICSGGFGIKVKRTSGGPISIVNK